MCGSRGGGGAGLSGRPLENYENIGFLSNTAPDPLKITKLPIQHSMLGHHLIIGCQNLNDVSLAGRGWPVYGGIRIIPSLIKKQKQNKTKNKKKNVA